MELIAQRFNKRVYKDGEKLVKIFNHQVMPKPKVLKEAWMQSLIESVDLNVPKVLEVYSVKDDWAIDFEFVHGDSLEAIMEKDPTHYKKYLDQLIDLQLEVFKKQPLGLPDMKEKFNKKISALGKEVDPRKHIEATIRYELHVCLDRMLANKKLCHGDFLPDNILIGTDGKQYIFDWSHATLGCGAADAANSYMKMKLDKRDTWADYYLKSYAKKTDTAIQEIMTWVPVVCATMLDKVQKPEEIDFLVKQINLIEFQ